MTSMAKPLPAPRRIPPEKRMEGSVMPTHQMESEETEIRPKPPLRPKPKVLPKPLAKSPSQDTGAVLPSSIPWSPKSPISEVPSAEKINLLTGPKPYGATASGVGTGIRRPSFTLKRQQSETLPLEEACSSTLASVSRASVVLPSSPPPSVEVPSPNNLNSVAQTEVDSVRQEPAHKEAPATSSNIKDVRPPVMKKPAVSFRVKPVLGASKPSRFPGTTVEQILAKMEEDKMTGTASGPERSWAQRTAASFDGGSRFGSTTYASFRRSSSSTEGPREEEEEKLSKEDGTAEAAGVPASPLYQEYTAWRTPKHGQGLDDATALQKSFYPSGRSPERQTDSASTVPDHLKSAASSTVVPEDPVSKELDLPSSSPWNRTAETSTPSLGPQSAFASMPAIKTYERNPSAQHMSSPPQTKGIKYLPGRLPSEQVSLESNLPVSVPPLESAELASKDHSSVSLEKELSSSLLLGGVPLGPAESMQISEQSSRPIVENRVDPSVYSEASVDRELVSSLLLGGAPLSLSPSPPASKIITPREAEGVGSGPLPKVENSTEDGHSSSEDVIQTKTSCLMDIRDAPTNAEHSLGGADWSLSESFEWSSPSRSSEWAMRREHLPAGSSHEEPNAQRPLSDGASVPGPYKDYSLLGGLGQELKLSSEPGTDRSLEPATIGGRTEIDLSKTSVTAVTDLLDFSHPEVSIQKHPGEVSVEDNSSEIEYPRWERRKYSGDTAGSSAPETTEGGEASSGTSRDMWRGGDGYEGRVSAGLVGEGLGSGGLGFRMLAAEGSFEQPQEEQGFLESRVHVLHANEVFEAHSGNTGLFQVESEPSIGRSVSEMVDARGLLEPLRPVLLSDPAAEPCVLYHGHAPVEHAVPSWEDDTCLAVLEARGEQPQEVPHFGNDGEDPSCGIKSLDRFEAQNSEAMQGQTFEVRDFDPMQGSQGAEKAPGAKTSDSHWLEELLSPTPAIEDLKQESEETSGIKDSEHGLLGWSQKDLQSEFGAGGAQQTSHGSSVWDDQYGFGGTNQSQELNIGNIDWSEKHGVAAYEWRTESESPNIDWSVKHNIDEVARNEEPAIHHRDWSIKQSIGETDHGEEHLIPNRDVSVTESVRDRVHGEEPGIIGSDWSIKHRIAEQEQSEEPRIGSRDWTITHSVEEREPEIFTRDWPTKPTMEEKNQREELRVGSIDWSVQHSMEERDQSEEPRILGRDWSIKQSMGDTDQGVESGLHTEGWSLKSSVGETFQSEGRNMSNRDWSPKHSFVETSDERESGTYNLGLSVESNTGENDGSRESDSSSSRDWSIKHKIGEIGQSEESEIHNTEWSMQGILNDQSTEPNVKHRVLEDASISVMDQQFEGGCRSVERGTHIEGVESGLDIGMKDMRGTARWAENEHMEIGSDIRRVDLLREIGDGDTERRVEVGTTATEGEMETRGLEREMGDGEMERTWENDIRVVGRTDDIDNREMHRSYLPDGQSSDVRDALSTHDSKDVNIRSSQEALQSDLPSNNRIAEMLARGASFESPQRERPTSLQSNQSLEGEAKPMDYASSSSFPGDDDSPVTLAERGGPIQVHPDVEDEGPQPDAADAVDAGMLVEEAGEAEVDFSFLEDAEVLDSSLYRTRASLNRKRGHRAPTGRPGAALNSTEVDGDEWMFQDSTEPKVPRADSSDEEPAAGSADVEAEQEEQLQKSPKKSPVSHGKKLGIFAGFNPMALKAKLKSRKSAEEGEQPKSPRQKDTNFQRSKSCKLPAESGKPLVLPPKPEKPAGSESSTPQWLNALKIKKKPQK
ncbi:182 kDa tankyrase-1-binding protein [Ambystoma mexicanum]|uniref:182 kDa tankyrase-1-binding protein n=1 Tax=Ambystoma mexicanum TaxID=8296 RepID=UPI0037E8FA71